MRKKISVLMTVAAMACSTLLACGSKSTTTYASETIYGEVTAVSDSGFTMTVGTYSDGQISLGDESIEINVTDSTEYTMGGLGTADGAGPSGDRPELEGEAPNDSNIDDEDTTTDSSSESDSTDSTDSSDDASSEDTSESQSDADNPQDNGEGGPGNKPDGNGQGGQGQPADMPSGEGQGQAPADMPSGEGQGQTPADMPQQDAGNQTTSDMPELSLSDISVGTQLAVTFDADGNVEKVEILNLAVNQ